MKIEIDIRIGYEITNNRKNLLKADDLYKSFQNQFEIAFPNCKLNGVHISKREIEKKKS